MNDGKGTTTICPVCGAEFRRRSKGQTYCNRKCSAMGRNENSNRVKKKQLHCKICGASLANRKCRTVYCCDECAKIGGEKMRKERVEYRKYKHVCANCGRTFNAREVKRKYCSVACRQAGVKEVMEKKSSERADAETNRGETVLLVVRRQPAVHPEFMPRLGTVYAGVRYRGFGPDVFLVPGFGKYGLILRPDEVKVVKG